MSKSIGGNEFFNDYDWDEEEIFDETEDESNKTKKKQISRRLKVKRRMDDYIEFKKAKLRARYLDYFDYD
ncbi:hypothetical protein [Leucothrix arctica]|uniref:Uncharacterized protein n=1 Tax=Leucothrix arctica TaxID=1481894 RepID=A0A317CBM0_9GAMM|nr:hypothetical protein [Leucothrix arctica]PWQ93750.1 hypothetical protein DKT75_19260 [Leucothrix arctica]